MHLITIIEVEMCKANKSSQLQVQQCKDCAKAYHRVLCKSAIIIILFEVTRLHLFLLSCEAFLAPLF